MKHAYLALSGQLPHCCVATFYESAVLGDANVSSKYLLR